ncbi:MAG: ABC transporter permease, partial [Actinobacteria bacterium]
MAEPATDFTLDTAQVLAEEEHGASIVGRSPWYLAWRRLRRNYIAFIALFVFVVIAVACSLAPIYAHHIAHTAPNATHTEDIVNGKQVLSAPVIGTDAQGNVVVEKAGGVLGPTWWHAHGRFVLGADGLGRDVAVRLLYGGLNSLKIGIGSALICVMVAVLLALLAGFYGGWVDWIITRSFDLIWAFPVLLLAIALGSALSINGFHHFGISISPHSLWIPTLV